MKAYKFVTKVSESGIIQLPYNPSLFNKEVEVFIVPKPKPEKNKMMGIEFVEKWAGFLSNDDTDRAKFEYLADKYK